MGQVVIQYLAALLDDILGWFGGLTGTDFDLLQMRSVDFANGKVFQLLQNILLLDRGSRHISSPTEFSGFCKQILNGGMTERIGVEQNVSFIHKQEQFFVRVKTCCL